MGAGASRATPRTRLKPLAPGVPLAPSSMNTVAYFSVDTGMMAGTGLGTLAFMALGYALAGLIPTTQVAQVVGNILAFPLLALSGATVPLEVLPPAAQNIARFFPLTHLVNLLRGLWLGEGWQRHVTETVVLTGMLLAGAALAAWVFRWE